MSTQRAIVITVIVCGVLACLLFSPSDKTQCNDDNRLITLDPGRHRLSLTTLALVLNDCKTNGKPVHPQITRWTSRSLITAKNQMAQTNTQNRLDKFSE